MIKIGDFSKLAQVSVKALRYYDKLGLLKPTWIDRYTGYRYYELAQLSQVNRILMLKELGLSLQQIQHLLADALSGDELRGMLRLRQAEVEHQLEQERIQLARIKVRLEQLDQEGVISKYDVIVKPVPLQYMIGQRQIIPDRQTIVPLFHTLHARLGQQLQGTQGVSQPTALYYDTEYHEQKIDVEALLPTRSQGGAGKTLPAIQQMACTLHQGSLSAMQDAHTSLLNWVEVNGYRVTGPNRDVYLQGVLPIPSPDHTASPDLYITEVQYPIEKRPPLHVVTGIKEMNNMEPKIITKSAFTLVGMKYTGKNENDEIKDMWGEFISRMDEIQHLSDEENSFGACWDTHQNEEFDYIAGLPVSNTVDIPEGMESREIKEQQYAVFTCLLPQLGETFAYVYKTWLPESDYTRGDGPEFELYNRNFTDENPALDLYIPIKSKA